MTPTSQFEAIQQEMGRAMDELGATDLATLDGDTPNAA